MKIFELQNISFAYENTKTLFAGLTSSVHKGDFIGIFGENGKGKTTLVQLILGLLKPQLGRGVWYDENEKELSKNPYNIEYISQKSNALESVIPITVQEIVNMGNKPKGSVFTHFTHDCSYETIETALKHVHMHDFIHRPFHELSGGQKQRVLIAKALVSNPDIIIMDEPTAGVDLMAQQHFYDLIEHLNQKHHITILLISHDTRFIQDKIKRLWYIGAKNCYECANEEVHLANLKKIFPKQNIEFFGGNE